ncbi:MAG: hypothetical protein K0U68_00705 [Gammaproteobacteria bacterium]|nr:hypothetical protein [Gammaproteobacteria bacterium]
MKHITIKNKVRTQSHFRRIKHGLILGLLCCQSAIAADFKLAGPACPAGGNGPRVVRLSDEIPGDCNDVNQVQNLIFQIGQTGTLIIDKTCHLNAGIRIPSRFTLKGTGIGSSGILAFSHDGIAISVCQEQPRSYVTIADLDMYGPYSSGDRVSAPHSTGIALANLNIVYLNNIRVSNFFTGVSGTNSYSVFINGSNISTNEQDNIRIGYASNSWRIRDGLVSQAKRWGINVLGPGDSTPVDAGDPVLWDTSNDLLIDGVRMESNGMGGIRTNAHSTRIINTRLEFNGHAMGAPLFQGVLLDESALNARLLTNYFSGNCIQNLGIQTEMAHNIDALNCQPVKIDDFKPN